MASSERVYEDFVPPHQMEREPATHTLTVNLSAQGKQCVYPSSWFIFLVQVTLISWWA